MSRCFPFPPPGYEKKLTTDEPDLLKKEKRKEKKHKKDKKDKDKKEGKEKREKDRSEGKHKDKKDKKDKHRDKKKDKEKDKEKDKGKTGSTQIEGHNGENIHHNNEQSQVKKPTLPFGNGESSHKISSSDDKKKPSTQFQGQNGNLARNRDTENFKYVQELDRRIRDEEKGTGSHQFMVEGRKSSFNGRQPPIIDRNKINGTTPPPPPPKLQPPPPPLPPSVPPPPPLVDKRVDHKDKVQEKESEDKRGDKRKHKDRDKDKQRAGKEKDGEKEKKEKKEREKNKHVKKTDSIPVLNNFSSRPPESSSEGILKKRKDVESNGVSHENEPRPNKMARHIISNISPENGRKLDYLQNPSSSFLDKPGASPGAPMGAPQNSSFKMGSKTQIQSQTQSQRVNGMISSSSPPVPLPPKKPPPVSGFNHVHKPSPIKSPPVITNHVPTKSVLPALSSPPPPPPPVSRPKPPPAAVTKAAPPPPPPKKPKPPHPDTKYLNQILTVPKLDPWSGFDEQEWLFTNKDKPRSQQVQVQVQVWSEAKQIESVDICALPYVIPY